jgi:ribonuclease VapC
MVIDTSALVAILFGEPDAERFAHALDAAPVRLLSAVTRVELSFVVEGRKGETGRADLELLLRDGDFDVAAVTPQQAEYAIEAFRRFGRGRHRAALNIGDCFSYALAVAADDTLSLQGRRFRPYRHSSGITAGTGNMSARPPARTAGAAPIAARTPGMFWLRN